MPKKIQTRIQNKHDIEANWKLATGFIPLAGELIIYDEDENYSYKRFKLGDGILNSETGTVEGTPVSDLPFYVLEADNLTFDDDITITTAVGNITIDSSGSGTIPAKGKNLRQVFEAMFTEEKDPTVTSPAVVFNTGLQYKEVGATVTPSYSVTLNPGSYSYGPATNITPASWSVSFSSQTKDTATGTFNNITITEGACCTVSATATYADGTVPKTNLGNDCSGKQIKAGTATNSKNLFTGYRPNFYGFSTTILDLNSLNSSVIRNLTTNQTQTTTPVTYAKCDTSWMQFFYAVPKGRKTSLSVKDSNNLPLTVQSKEVTVNHEGSASSTYTVFYINNDAAYGATTLALTWS